MKLNEFEKFKYKINQATIPEETEYCYVDSDGVAHGSFKTVEELPIDPEWDSVWATEQIPPVRNGWVMDVVLVQGQTYPWGLIDTTGSSSVWTESGQQFFIRREEVSSFTPAELVRVGTGVSKTIRERNIETFNEVEKLDEVKRNFFIEEVTKYMDYLRLDLVQEKGYLDEFNRGPRIDEDGHVVLWNNFSKFWYSPSIYARGSTLESWGTNVSTIVGFADPMDEQIKADRLDNAGNVIRWNGSGWDRVGSVVTYPTLKDIQRSCFQPGVVKGFKP